MASKGARYRRSRTGFRKDIWIKTLPVIRKWRHFYPGGGISVMRCLGLSLSRLAVICSKELHSATSETILVTYL